MIQPTDLLLVERSGAFHRIAFSDLNTRMQADDLLLVERNQTLYKLPWSARARAVTGDLLMVERSQVLYKTDAKLVFAGGIPVAPVIESVVLTPGQGASGRLFDGLQVLTTVNMTENGVPDPTLELKAWATGTGGLQVATGNVTKAPVPGTWITAMQARLYSHTEWINRPASFVKDNTYSIIRQTSATSSLPGIEITFPGVVVPASANFIRFWFATETHTYVTIGSPAGLPQAGSATITSGPFGAGLSCMEIDLTSIGTVNIGSLPFVIVAAYTSIPVYFVGISFDAGDGQGEVPLLNSGPFFGTSPGDDTCIVASVPPQLSVGATVHQGQSSAVITAINGNTLTLSQFQGSIVTGAPLTATITSKSVQGGNIASTVAGSVAGQILSCSNLTGTGIGYGEFTNLPVTGGAGTGAILSIVTSPTAYIPAAGLAELRAHYGSEPDGYLDEGYWTTQHLTWTGLPQGVEPEFKLKKTGDQYEWEAINPGVLSQIPYGASALYDRYYGNETIIAVGQAAITVVNPGSGYGTNNALSLADNALGSGSRTLRVKVTAASSQSTGGLVLTTNAGLDQVVAGATVRAGSAHAQVATVDPTAKRVLFAADSGSTWTVGTPVTFDVPVYGRSFFRFNASGQINAIQSADPGWTQWNGGPQAPYSGSLSFPVSLDNGQHPDDVLQPGDAITVEARASNSEGSSTKTSNSVTPMGS